jgi:hypothetical protein
MKKIETRLRVLEMATEIAAEAAQNTNVVWMIEFQEELIERLFRKMISLIDDEPAVEEEKERTTDEEH